MQDERCNGLASECNQMETDLKTFRALAAQLAEALRPLAALASRYRELNHDGIAILIVGDTRDPVRLLPQHAIDAETALAAARAAGVGKEK